MGFCRNILNVAFLLLNTLLILLGATSLGIAAGQWTSVVSDDVTLSELIATHAQYTRALIALFLILGGCLVLVGLAGLVAAILLLANRLKGTAVFFLSVFCLSSCVMVTSYIVMTTYFWHDSTLVTPLVFEELTTRLTGPAYPANDFQFGSYWDTWQLENHCCGIQNGTEFYNSVAATNAGSPQDWLPDSCCLNQTLPQGSCRRTDSSYFSSPCRYSLYSALTAFYWSQLAVVITIWTVYLALVPVTLAVWSLLWIPTDN